MILKKENISLKKLLLIKLDKLNKIIKPGFNFGTVTKKDNPKEYFASVVLDKVYSLNISTENSLHANDVFLSIYLYRYVYELYIKILYIFSGSSEEQVLFRLNEFFNNKKWNIKDIKNDISDNFLPPQFKNNHEEIYKKICRFVHPNIDSFKLHLNKNDDQLFEFLVPNINLTIWHIIEIVKLFSSKKILNLDKNINQLDLKLLQ
jgi:hypothetical protein